MANNAAKSLINKKKNDIINTRKVIQNRVESGEYNLTLSKQHYLKHVECTKQYDDYLNTRTARGQTPQSRITISEIEAQDIIVKKYGTGKPRKRDDGTVVNIEFVDADNIVGKFYSNGQWIDTKELLFTIRNARVILFQWRIRMVNIWDFVNANKVKLTNMKGKEFIGTVMAVFDKDETYDEEDSIDILVNGEDIGFLQSEIKSIEVLD